MKRNRSSDPNAASIYGHTQTNNPTHRTIQQKQPQQVRQTTDKPNITTRSDIIQTDPGEESPKTNSNIETTTKE